MSAVKELFLQTEALVEFVNQPFPADDDERDRYIAELDRRLEERDQFITKLDANSLSGQEKKLGQELVKLNNRLNKRLSQVQAEIKANLSHIKKKKETHRKYENPYEGPSSEGIFFDKRGI